MERWERERILGEWGVRDVAAWRGLAEECRRDQDAFARRWRGTAERWGFTAVNELIDRHNRYFPAESRLPMDPTTGDFVLIDGRPYRRRILDADWVLERPPPGLERAIDQAAA